MPRSPPDTAPSLEQVQPMLAETGAGPFDREGWLFELKYDGYRLLAEAAPDRARLLTRRRNDVTADYPAIARALKQLGRRALLDGELVAVDPQGRPSFELLQQGSPPVFFAFDLLALDGRDLRALPLSERKARLRALLAGKPPLLHFVDHLETRGAALFAQVEAMGLEGVMAKRSDSPYRAGRSEDWLKLCVDRRADLVVVGYSLSDSARGGLGALHLAGYEDGQLRYAGKVGAAMPEALRAKVLPALASRRIAAPPCTFPPQVPVPGGPTECWCEPELCCEVRYKELTRSGVLRLPIFQRLRADKPLTDCRIPRAPVKLP